MKITFISDPKAVWRHYSTIALSFAASIQGVWAALPEHVKNNLPQTISEWVAWVTFLTAMLGLAGKFIDQTPKEAP